MVRPVSSARTENRDLKMLLEIFKIKKKEEIKWLFQ